MTKLYIMRGVPGSGKSTWIKNNNLEDITVSSDAIRLEISPPVINDKGDLSINQVNDGRVWALVRQRIEERMQLGLKVIVDATNKRAKDFKPYLDLAQQYSYKVFCIDFSHLPLETCLIQNNKRKGHYSYVPEEVIVKHYEIIKNSNIPQGVTKLNPADIIDK